jgi:hypothetical protein
MKTLLPITQVVSTKCGGYGAWIDNPLNTPAPSSSSWRGFQMGGSRKRRHGTRRKHRRHRRNIYRQRSRKSRK